MTFREKDPTEKDLEKARKLAHRFVPQYQRGVDIAKLSTRTGLNKPAIRAILKEQGIYQGDAVGKSGAAGSVDSRTPNPEVQGAPKVTPVADAPPAVASSPSSPPASAGGSQEHESRSSRETSTQPPLGGWPTGAQMGSGSTRPIEPQVAFGTGLVTPPSGPDRLSGTVTRPDIYENLLDILMFFGVKDDKAKGLVLIFRYANGPTDYKALEELVALATMNPQNTALVMKAWRKITAEPQLAPGEGTPREEVSQIRRELGLEQVGGRPADLTRLNKEALEEEKLRMDIDEARAEVKMRRDAAAAKLAGAVPSPTGTQSGPGMPGSLCPPGWLDQPMIIGGMPQTLRIRQEQLPFYARWIPGPDGKLESERQSVPVGPPADDPEKAELKRQVKEAKEREREREREERDAARHKEFLDAIAALRPQGPSPDAVALAREKEDRQREREERRDRELEDERKHRREMEAEMLRRTDPMWVSQQRERQMKEAETLGMVRPETVGKIKEDDIHLTALRDAETLKSTTATETMKMGMDMAKKVVDGDTAGGKLKNTVIDKIGPLIDHEIQKHIASDPVNVGSVDVPLPEGALERAAAAAQHELGTDGSVTPLTTPPGSGAPPMSAGDVAKARPETGR